MSTVIHEKGLREKDQKKSEGGNSADVVGSDENKTNPEDFEKNRLNDERDKAKLLRIEQREKERIKGKGKKRSMDVDAVSRFTSSSSKPKKAKSVEDDTNMDVIKEYDNIDDHPVGKDKCICFKTYYIVLLFYFISILFYLCSLIIFILYYCTLFCFCFYCQFRFFFLFHYPNYLLLFYSCYQEVLYLLNFIVFY